MSNETTWPAPLIPARSMEGARASPTGPSPGVRRAIKSTVIAGALAAAIGPDHPPASASIAVAIVVLALGLAKAIGADRRTASVISVGAICVAPWLAIRSSAWLLVPDAIAAIAVLAVGLSIHRGAELSDSAAGIQDRLRRGGVGLMAAPLVAVRGAQSIVGTERRAAARVVLLPALIGSRRDRPTQRIGPRLGDRPAVRATTTNSVRPRFQLVTITRCDRARTSLSVTPPAPETRVESRRIAPAGLRIRRTAGVPYAMASR